MTIKSYYDVINVLNIMLNTLFPLIFLHQKPFPPFIPSLTFISSLTPGTPQIITT